MHFLEEAKTLAAGLAPDVDSAHRQALIEMFSNFLSAVALAPLNGSSAESSLSQPQLRPPVWDCCRHLVSLWFAELARSPWDPPIALLVTRNFLTQASRLFYYITEEELHVYSAILDASNLRPDIPPQDLDEAIRNLSMRKLIHELRPIDGVRTFEPVLTFVFSPPK